MNMTPVTSSMLSHIGYDAETMTLMVKFNPSKKQAAAGEPGDTWQYSPVISERWDEAQAVLADPEGSIGKWFLGTIKGKYDGVKLPARQDYKLVDGEHEKVWLNEPPASTDEESAGGES